MMLKSVHPSGFRRTKPATCLMQRLQIRFLIYLAGHFISTLSVQSVVWWARAGTILTRVRVNTRCTSGANLTWLVLFYRLWVQALLLSIMVSTAKKVVTIEIYICMVDGLSAFWLGWLCCFRSVSKCNTGLTYVLSLSFLLVGVPCLAVCT